MQLTPTQRVRPAWFAEALVKDNRLRLFLDDQRFNDDVHGPLYLNALERDLIDSPEFQRLFRLGQLGFVDHVYQGANHTRGAHSIAVCALAKHITDLLNANTVRVANERASQASRDRGARTTESRGKDPLKNTPLGESNERKVNNPPRVSFASSVLVALGALLHDLPHGPFSHDIERKSHVLKPPYSGNQPKHRSHYGPYDKHDDFEHNPALYVYMLDSTHSVLARILRAHSPLFWELMLLEYDKDPSALELRQFIEIAKGAIAAGEWSSDELLPALLFHLLVVEKPSEVEDGQITVATSFESSASPIRWGLGNESVRKALHEAWYQPYRHDVIGDTVSADLIDYLLRDVRRLGFRRKPDLRMLDFYVLSRTSKTGAANSDEADWTAEHRCAIDLNDYKRGTIRLDLVNDLLRMLDLRFEIHEKAVYHRVVQASIAMLSRAIFFLEQKPEPRDSYGLGASSPALAGDEAFLQHLVELSQGKTEADLAQRLAERRVYRPLMVVPGDRLHAWLLAQAAPGQTGDVEADLRLFAAIMDSRYYQPFLCYLAWAIEKLLKHAYVDVAELRCRALDLLANDAALQEARERHSERVIFWALPYKQLHKDLTVVVRVRHMNQAGHQDLVTGLDGLGEACKELNSPDDLKSLARRVDDGIADADSKYASLWKMYVFLSDGLFSTGVIAKFGGEHGCGGARGEQLHEKCLRRAQGLVLEGMRAIWMHWHTLRDDGAAPNLSAVCPDTALRLLLKMLRGDSAELELKQDYIPDATKLSAVAVDQYLHHSGEHLGGARTEERCRDMRFKYPRPADEAVLADLLDGIGVTRDQQQEVIQLMGLVPHAGWTEEEALELAHHLANGAKTDSRSVIEFANAAKGSINLPVLRAKWLLR